MGCSVHGRTNLFISDALLLIYVHMQMYILCICSSRCKHIDICRHIPIPSHYIAYKIYIGKCIFTKADM